MPSTHTYTLSLHDALPIFVNNYLKGKSPEAFDLLYWNADSTNLPGPMYCWYVRNTYLENKLCEPGKTSVAGLPLDFGKVALPADRKSTRLNSSHMSISYAVHSYLHSFPTRRSSDLRQQLPEGKITRGLRPALLERGLDQPPRTDVLLVCAQHLSGEQTVRAGQDFRCGPAPGFRESRPTGRSEEHTSELQSHVNIVCRPLIPTLFPYTTLFRSSSTTT